MLQKIWERGATALALIGLIDLSGQLIHWAILIHWLVSKYEAAKAVIFLYAPFHVPDRFKTPLLLLLILFSVTGVGLFRKRRRLLVAELAVPFVLVGFIPTIIILAVLGRNSQRERASKWMENYLSHSITIDSDPETLLMVWLRRTAPNANVWLMAIVATLVGSIPLGALGAATTFIGSKSLAGQLGEVLVASLIYGVMMSAVIIAWEWVLTTVIIFAAVILVNQIYVTFLQ